MNKLIISLLIIGLSLIYSCSDNTETKLISNVENPGVSAIYVFSSISYNFVDVVVFLPFLFLWLISPSCVIVSLNIALISVDFPTPEFPENAFIFPFKFFSKLISWTRLDLTLLFFPFKGFY